MSLLLGICITTISANVWLPFLLSMSSMISLFIFNHLWLLLFKKSLGRPPGLLLDVNLQLAAKWLPRPTSITFQFFTHGVHCPSCSPVQLHLLPFLCSGHVELGFLKVLCILFALGLVWFCLLLSPLLLDFLTRSILFLLYSSVLLTSSSS